MNVMCFMHGPDFNIVITEFTRCVWIAVPDAYENCVCMCVCDHWIHHLLKLDS
jgi:hypothetical protein